MSKYTVIALLLVTASVIISVAEYPKYGYSEIVVSIDNDIHNIDCRPFLENIFRLMMSVPQEHFHLNKGRVLFNRVVIILPHGLTNCGIFIWENRNATRADVHRASIRVQDGPLMGQRFWSQKSGTCPTVGNFVGANYRSIMGMSGMKDSQDSKVLAQAFLQEWGKFTNSRGNDQYGYRKDRDCSKDPLFDKDNVPEKYPAQVGPMPKFIVKQIRKPTWVLLVEQSRIGDSYNVWLYLRVAVRKFLKYDLPKGAQIGIVTYTSKNATILANMTTIQSEVDREQLALALPVYPETGHGTAQSEFTSGIILVIDILKRTYESASGAVVILASAGTTSREIVQEGLNILLQEDVSMATIEFPSTGQGRSSILSNGPHFTILSPNSYENFGFKSYMGLLNAFVGIQTFFAQDVEPPWPVIIHQAEYLDSVISSSFWYEAGANHSPAEFYVYTFSPCYNELSKVEVTSPTGTKFTTINQDLCDVFAISVDAVVNQTGLWRYEIQRSQRQKSTLFVQVVSKTFTDDYQSDVYTNGKAEIPQNLKLTPLILYVEVKRRNLPVLGARVQALIEAGTKTWSETLYDNGMDPDLQSQDGIYSRYCIAPPGIVSIRWKISVMIIMDPGRAIKVKAVNGSQQKFLLRNEKKYIETSPFERYVPGITIHVSNIPSKGFYPPGHVQDFKILTLDKTNPTINFEYTPPGNNLDHGVPSYCKLLLRDDKERVWSTLKTVVPLKNEGEKNRASVGLNSTGNYTLSIKCVSMEGKTGKMSNIVEVKILPSVGRTGAKKLFYINCKICKNPQMWENLRDLKTVYAIIILLIILLTGVYLGFRLRKPIQNAGSANI